MEPQNMRMESQRVRTESHKSSTENHQKSGKESRQKGSLAPEECGIDTFEKLTDALQLIGEYPGEQLRIFADELDKTGRRKYLVCSASRFFEFYSKLHFEEKHYSEVIINEEPCRLYFVVKFVKEFNPKVHGARWTRDFINFVCVQIKNTYGIHCSVADVMQLDASDREKFVRQLVFHLPNGMVFENHSAVGRFVAKFVEDLKDLKKPHFVVKKQSRGKLIEVPFCDTSLYKSSQNLHVFQSAQFGAANHLAFSPDNYFELPPKRNRASIENAIFKNSLVQVLNYRRSDLLRFDVFPIHEGACKEIEEKASDLAKAPKEASIRCEAVKQGEYLRYTFGRDHVDARHHKITVHLNLRQMVLYQTCFDPRCRQEINSSSVNVALDKKLEKGVRKIWKSVYGSRSYTPCFHGDKMVIDESSSGGNKSAAEDGTTVEITDRLENVTIHQDQ